MVASLLIEKILAIIAICIGIGNFFYTHYRFETTHKQKLYIDAELEANEGMNLSVSNSSPDRDVTNVNISIKITSHHHRFHLGRKHWITWDEYLVQRIPANDRKNVAGLHQRDPFKRFDKFVEQNFQDHFEIKENNLGAKVIRLRKPLTLTMQIKITFRRGIVGIKDGTIKQTKVYKAHPTKTNNEETSQYDKLLIEFKHI